MAVCPVANDHLFLADTGQFGVSLQDGPMLFNHDPHRRV